MSRKAFHLARGKCITLQRQDSIIILTARRLGGRNWMKARSLHHSLGWGEVNERNAAQDKLRPARLPPKRAERPSQTPIKPRQIAKLDKGLRNY